MWMGSGVKVEIIKMQDSAVGVLERKKTKLDQGKGEEGISNKS